MKNARLVALFVVVFGATAAAQTPVKTVDGGVLDEIHLFVESPGTPTELAIVIHPFDAQSADLGTGGKEGKEKRQAEAQMIQKQGPQMLADATAAALQKSGPFKSATVLAPDAPAPPGALKAAV